MIALLLLVAAPQLRYDVTRDGAQLTVTLNIDAEAWGSDAYTLCTGIGRAGRAIKTSLSPLPEDSDCFGPLKHEKLTHTYTVSLRKLSGISNDPDYAMGDPLRDGWIASDLAMLLRPESLDADTEVRTIIDGDARTFDADQLFGGAYVLFSKDQRALSYGDKRVTLTRYKPSSGPSDDVLRNWVNDGVKALSRFHGGLPTPMHVILVPVPLLSRGGVFGTVLRRANASVVLMFGANADEKAFTNDWVTVHEIFHAGMPHVRGRPAWFIEGFTTYYQDALRAMWDDLDDGNKRFCQPTRGRSLRTESREVRKTHEYQRVYWGGACMAHVLDVKLKKKGSSLDEVIRAMFKKSREEMLDEDEVIGWFDRETDGLATRLLDETKHIEVPPVTSAK